jgi:flagellar hook-associated protein 1 FlgK
MSNILAALLSSAYSLDTYNQVLTVTQNNVANASTPGYAKQSLPLESVAFDLQGGAGGVRPGELESARNEYAEQAVRRQQSVLGFDQQKVNSLTALEGLFDVTGDTGIPKALNGFFQAASAWAASPTNQAARQTFLSQAQAVASTFQKTAGELSTVVQNTENQARDTVSQVNRLLTELQSYNIEARKSGRSDASLDARIHSAMEELSNLVDFTVVQQKEGSVTLMLNGDTPLLVGDKIYPLTFSLCQPVDPPPVYPSSPAGARVQAADGMDVTAKISTGELGALLDLHNRVLASYLGDSTQAGDLNRMAKQFADRVNSLLSAGHISDDPSVQPGVPLFTYDAANDTNVARTLTVDPTVATSQLAVIDPGPPSISNGVPLAISKLASPDDDVDKIDGISFQEFYGAMGSRVGSELDVAGNGVQVQQSVVAQAKNIRQQLSGVSLDQEAAILLEFQRAYQATARFLTALDEMAQETMNLIR